jgi:HAD superfamily hydrolase (TIGR01509 family)
MNDETKLRAVVFDLDGLLVNTEDLYAEAGETVLRRRGKTYDAELREQMMGRPVVDAIQLMIDCHALPDTIDDLMCECKTVLDELMAKSLAPMPGVERLLDALAAANIPVAVATSATPEYAEHVLSTLGLKRRFQFILTAADIRHGKPNPEVYLLAAKRLGIPPSAMMVLEDSGNGCRAAVDSGAYAVAVPNSHTHNHKFPAVQLMADTLADPRILRALNLLPSQVATGDSLRRDGSAI